MKVSVIFLLVVVFAVSASADRNPDGKAFVYLGIDASKVKWTFDSIEPEETKRWDKIFVRPVIGLTLPITDITTFTSTFSFGEKTIDVPSFFDRSLKLNEFDISVGLKIYFGEER